MQSVTMHRSEALNARPAQRGFTLLEIMIVVVIIGIMISLATISIGPVIDNNLDEDGRRFEALLELALEDAGIQGREFGLQFYQHGYEFAARVRETNEDGELVWVWVPLTAHEILKPRDLGEDIAIDLEIDGSEMTLLYEYDSESEEEYRPQVFILSSGDIEPAFRLTLRQVFGDNSLTLNINETGEVETDDEAF